MYRHKTNRKLIKCWTIAGNQRLYSEWSRLERMRYVREETDWLRWGRMAGVCIGLWWEIQIDLVRLYFSLKAEKYIKVSELGRWHDGFRKISMSHMYR